MSTIVLVVLAFLVGVFVLPVLQGLFTDEARGWLPHLARAMVRAAARRLPPARERYEEEWLAELAAYNDRRLTALFRACSLSFGARALSAELDDEVAAARVSILDRVVAGLGLLFLAPMLVLIVVAIKLDSRGPALFRQPRIRPDGSRFVQLKFRTMVHSSRLIIEWNFNYRALQHVLSPSVSVERPAEEFDGVHIVPTWEHFRTRSQVTIPAALVSLVKVVWSRLPPFSTDPRVTRVGRFLRRYSLDELPLLFNVLRGDMALPYPWRIQGP